ncbi:hypothetical protein HDV05_004868 [Chytridiales sp. JEL 0842]|nr:hypothetical protein HDV05_004868 [Chytridiales sp. JEL 0842]
MVAVANFKSSALFEQIKSTLDAMPAAEKAATIKKVNGVFHMVVKNAEGVENTWTLELKKEGAVSLGPQGKADITINLGDDVFLDLASGKLNGQKAFMQGKLKVKGNIMLASKLDTVLKSAQSAAPKAAAAPAAPVTPAAAPKAEGGVDVPGFASSAVFAQIHGGLTAASPAEREATVKKVKGIFQFDVKGADGKIQTWTLDLKTGAGSVITGAGSAKPDIVIAVADKDFVDLAGGKLNGQKAFMSGKIKVKGQIMLAAKLDQVLNSLKPKAKL